jgi:hypothetical protein
MSWTIIVTSVALVIAGFLVCGALATAIGKEATEYYIKKRKEKDGIIEQPVDYEKKTHSDWLWAAGISAVVLLYIGAFIWAVL